MLFFLVTSAELLYLGFSVCLSCKSIVSTSTVTQYTTTHGAGIGSLSYFVTEN